MITCYVRYVLDMEKLDAFREYARLWIGLINQVGGTHHGYFLPNDDPQAENHGRFSFKGLGSEGPRNIGIAVFSFPDWEAYEYYRSEVGKHEACRIATKIVEDTACFTSYERNFMTPILA